MCVCVLGEGFNKIFYNINIDYYFVNLNINIMGSVSETRKRSKGRCGGRVGGGRVGGGRVGGGRGGGRGGGGRRTRQESVLTSAIFIQSR